MKNLFICFPFLLFLISCSKQPIEYTLEVNVTPQNSGTVTPSSGIYEDGTTVSIQGTPFEGFIFKEWTGSVSGSTNPITVSMNSDKIIVGVFEKKQYPLTITIEGEGTVTEELIQTKSTIYPHGSEVELTGVPSDGWKFVEWSGDVTSNENPITINIENEISVHVKFEKECMESYSLIDLKQPSYFTNILFHPPNILEILSTYDVKGYDYGMDKISIDYNRDGYLDFIGFFNDYGTYNRHPLKFFVSDCYGNLTIDETNSDKFLGMIHGRKILNGDYNNDGYPDIFFLGHGYDSDPFPGEYPLLLLSDSNGSFNEMRFTDYVGFFHSGCSGDFDNDGDLDVVVCDPQSQNSLVCINSGNGDFEVNRNIISDYKNNGCYTSELFDINNDGNLDLFLSGSDFDENNPPSVIVYGNGKSFNNNIVEILPTVTGYGICVDIDFYDINSDGSTEIIMNRTGDPVNGNGFYTGWYIQVLERINGEFVDSTEKFINDYYSESENWNTWMYIDDFEKTGQIEMRSSGHPDINHHNYVSWKLTDGKFLRVN
ncbi:VCBS repeat-containing protein [Draconibacterium sp. IB214405]|uniref:VCBS repeat-containing protein n=1 Tax=Draconibacterium sp. IB214405 TaxID=3097352 RepID=UPI002A0E74D1|nr:VCBS repeat-containing protein [Draconibacterium sp. IB214405]MDX8341203.1 VCBS repeat-containing protein [Draconibacterium sp. IB214405]